MLKEHPLFPLLSLRDRRYLHILDKKYRLTFQERRMLITWSRDLEMWQEKPLKYFWTQGEKKIAAAGPPRRRKKAILEFITRALNDLKRRPIVYPPFKHKASKTVSAAKNLITGNKYKVRLKKNSKKIFGACPVASPRTVCCNLRTIDAVENCIYNCTYCTIQTFYGKQVIFDRDFKNKIFKIRLAQNRLYHFGSGQSSDALAWGNKYNILETMCAFAARNPNVLMEFKTKSANNKYFIEHPPPANVVLSWTLNTQKVIYYEERHTARLEKRLSSAREAAAQDIKVAFHFHPLVYYQGWQEEYRGLAARLLKSFKPKQVAFISFGSVTFIKPVLKAMRLRGGYTKIHKTEMAADPHGKLTYNDDLKVMLFSLMYKAFKVWQDQVFFYLCMEKAEIWDRVFGWHYRENAEFEKALIKRALAG